MYIVIAGGGKIGYYLAKTMLPHKHKIIVIEQLMDACEKISNELGVETARGDATDIDKLAEIEVDKADVFIAVTGRDEDNLIACQLAKRNFGVKRTIARVNNPKNIMVFEKLGVDYAVSSTSIIADLIEQEVDLSGVKTLMRLKNRSIILSEIVIGKTSVTCGKSLRELEIPEHYIIVSIIRNEEVIIPNGFTRIQDGDYVIIVSTEENQMKLKEYFIG